MPRPLFLIFLFSSSLASRADEAIVFEKHVRPILKAHCFHCHGEEGKREGSLDVRLRRLIVAGGESGPAIKPGDASDSFLLDRIRSGEMPPGEKKLSGNEIQILEAWIAAGAKTARAEPASIGDEPLFTDEERNFWAFQPIRRTPPPTVANPSNIESAIDQFVLARLEREGLSYSPPADRLTLVRRAFFDLTGLPPSPSEVQTFLLDDSPDAFEHLVVRLLGSPRYGERWGRHWLDVAGYADSEGYTEDDKERTSAFRFRDYVIRSLNDDKPFDQFIREQLAGDEMVPLPHRNLSGDAVEKLTATGFLRMAPDGTGSGGIDQNVARNEVVADTIKIVSTSLLGLTVGCARCHDHRYDPISTADYYEMRAIFEPAFDWKKWRSPANRVISLYTDADRELKKKIEAQAVQVDNERKAKAAQYIDRTLEEELVTVDKSIRDPLRAAYKTPAAKRTPTQIQLLKEHPSIQNISEGSLYLYDRRRETKARTLDTQRVAKEKQFLAEARKQNPGQTITLANLSEFNAEAAAEIQRDKDAAVKLRTEKAADDLKRYTERANEIRAAIPEEGYIRALTEPANHSPATFVFYRGDHDQPKKQVEPGELHILGVAKFPTNDPALPSTGRRLAYAKHLTSGRHPLVARVIVNRIWMHHFGRGLVNSPGDFGYLGERPSHPDLLDWLADEFMRGGWQVKRIHKLIMTSTVYRQSSRRTEQLEQIDPDNTLYARMSIRRLESEAVRDSVLSVSGQLNQKMFGQPVPVMEDEVGQIVVGKENLDGERKPTNKIDLQGEEFRRSIYIQARRSRPLGVLETFDTPAMSPNCTERNASNVAPQSLMLMNSQFVVDYADKLASRLVTDVGDDLASQIIRAWQLVFGGKPSDVELKKSLEYLANQKESFAAKDPKMDAATQQHRALATLCQALISANRFIYID